MNQSIRKPLIAFLFAGAAALLAADSESSASPLPGTLLLNLRVRSETASQPIPDDAHALTLRTRLGFASDKFSGFSFLIEGENVVAADGDDYNQAGLNPGGAGKVVIADVEGTELNRLWVGYDHPANSVRLGRQRIVLDNARFVGDVGWRQDQQTYDAVFLANTSVKDLTVTYGYLDRINRIFAEERDWDSQSHLFNASYQSAAMGTITGYAYLLDFEDAAANSSATYGVSLAGNHVIDDSMSFLYRAEIASQSDYGDSPFAYRATYYILEAGIKAGAITGKVGWELLGSDNLQGFKTPLATLHKFNGFADVFLNTPAHGLQDLYASISGSPAKGLTLAAFYHQFTTGGGSTDYGSEIDLVASYKMASRFTAIAKYASYTSDTHAMDTDRLSFEVNFAY